MKNVILLFTFLLLYSCKSTQQLAQVSESSYRIDNKDVKLKDSTIIHLIAPYKAKLDVEMNDVIANAAITLKKARPQCTLGNWMADAVQLKAQEYSGLDIDFTSLNYGGIRIPELRKGPVTRGKIYELMPFENRIAILELKGSTVQRLLDHIASKGGWPISKEVKMLIDGDRAIDVSISGEGLSEQKTYRIVLPDYIANGGDRTDFLEGSPRNDLTQLIRDALIEYAEENTAKGKSIDAEIDHRIRVKE